MAESEQTDIKNKPKRFPAGGPPSLKTVVSGFYRSLGFALLRFSCVAVVIDDWVSRTSPSKNGHFHCISLYYTRLTMAGGVFGGMV